MTLCPRCGEGVAVGQEYCLECGLRLPGVTRLGAPPPDQKSIAVPLAVAAVIALLGAGAGIALTREDAAATPILTATGGSEVVPVKPVTAASLTEWPAGTAGWTNVLVSVPKIEGRDAALARAEQARSSGLRRVGVLDSSRYPSLQPGYWVVFSGIYTSEPEAASRLREARGVQRAARTARISR